MRALGRLLLLSSCLAAACDKPPAAPPAPPPTPAAAAPAPAPVAATPAHAEPRWRLLASADRGFFVRWAPEPDPIPSSEAFALLIELYLDEACTKPIVDGTLAVDAAMPHHGHGMNMRPKVESIGPGRYRASGLLFHMDGRWELAFDLSMAGLTERAQTTVNLP